jgi:5'(3')-deoxyribonucleotidase
MKKVLLLDVDGVIADCSSPVHSFAENLLGRPLPDPASWTAWDHAEAMDLNKDEARAFHIGIRYSGIANEITFYPGAREIVHELARAFDLVFVTAEWKGMDSWVPARQRLLEPFSCDVIFTHAKHRVKGDILIDDRRENVEHEDNKSRSFLFDRSYNRASTQKRIFSLKEILEHK